MVASRIIVVDDNGNMARTLSDILVLNGFKVTYSLSAREALEHIHKQPYDCLISDIKMPDMDGVQLSRQVKESAHPIPVILTTAYTTQHILQEMADLGVEKVFMKPIEVESLLGYLKTL